MNKEWSLDVLYKGYDTPEFKADLKKADEAVAAFNAAAETLGTKPAKETLVEIISMLEQQENVFFNLFEFCALKQSCNTKDPDAAAYMGQLMAKSSAMTKARTKLNKYVASIENLDEVIASDPILTEYGYMLHNIVEENKHLLSEEAEEIMSLYDISGGSAWGDLQSSLTSSVTADFRGDKVNLSAMEKWAVQYALHMTVLSPQSLADKIKSDILTAAGKYKDGEI